MKQQDRVVQQLRAVLESPQFAQSRRMQRFLEFVVGRTLKDDAAGIKEYTIGVEVFDRAADYDPRVDSIVRVEARRLRRKLREYYAGPGRDDAIVISLPEGSYVPVWSGAGIESRRSAGPAEPVAEEIRLAVLPLEVNPLGDDARMLAEGLTDDLLTSISRIPGVLVVTRSAALRYRDAERDLKSIAVELGVDWILEGALRRAGARWRLSVHLAECATGFARWSETYTVGPVELQSLHEEIARRVAEQFGEAPGEAPESTEHALSALSHLLEARHLMLQMTPRSLRRAAAVFRRATQADASLPAAWCGMAGSLLLMSLFGDTSPVMVAADADEAIRRALALDPDLPQAHLWRGFLRATHDWNWDAAEEDYLRALELNAGLCGARLWLAGTVHAPQGRFPEALEQLEAARKLDPANPLLGTVEGLVRAWSGDTAGALAVLEAARSLSQTYYAGHHVEARVLALRGDDEAALGILEQARPRAAEDPRNLTLIGCFAARLGRKGEAAEIAASLEKTRPSAYVAGYDMAALYAALGEEATAARYLSEALAEHEPWLIFIRQDPLIRPLERTPQYRLILETLFGPRPE